MLTYTAAYQFIDEGVLAQVLDFPGAVSCGTDVDDARRMLASALVDLAGYIVEQGEPLPRPDPSRHDDEADIQEPIYLHLRASTAIEVVPRGVVVP